MKSQTKPPVWKMLREAIEALGGKSTNVAVKEWILSHYPGTNPPTIAAQTIVCTVNHNSRIHYSDNQKPRAATAQHDFLFRPSTGELELYDPAKHGLWEIVEKEDGRLTVQQSGETENEKGEEGQSFAAETHLRDYLVKNLNVIEEDLQLFVDDHGNDGMEFRTEIGRIDILGVDKEGGLLIVELKVERGPDEVCGQIMRYMGWVKRHLANGRRVRGLIVARQISDRIRYALADIPDVSAKEYSLNIHLHDVPHIDTAKPEGDRTSEVKPVNLAAA